jgi:hypothetical protein
MVAFVLLVYDHDHYHHAFYCLSVWSNVIILKYTHKLGNRNADI